jgi:glycosyltransferase involved in cell wall biosynthesis
VSVAVPVFGDVRFLDEAVNSILAQSQPPHELILVDDGSASPEVTEALAAAQRRDPDLVRVVTQPNRGVCVARNRAWEEMTGDAYLFVDSDDVLHPEFIEATATALRSDASLWAVATWTRFFGEYEGVEAKPPFDRRVGSRENPVVGTAMLLGPEVRDAGLGFAPDLAFLYCEDWDLWSRIVAAGGRIGLVPRALATHRVHPSSGGHARTELAHAIGKARATAHLR